MMLNTTLPRGILRACGALTFMVLILTGVINTSRGTRETQEDSTANGLTRNGAQAEFAATSWVELGLTRPVVITTDRTPFDADEFELFKRTQAANIDRLLSKVVAELSLPLLKDVPHPIAFARSRMEVSFPHDGQLMMIRMRGGKNEIDQWAQVVTKITEAYVEWSRNDERSRDKRILELLKMDYEARGKALDRLSEQLRQHGQENAPGRSNDFAFFHREHQREKEVLRLIGEKCALLSINLASPSRVSVIDSTTIEQIR